MQIILDVIIIVLLFSVFAITHSYFATLEFKSKIKKAFPSFLPFYRLSYNFFSLFTFGLVIYFSPKPVHLVYELPVPYDLIIYFFQVLSLFGLIWTLKYIDLKEFVGISQIKRYLKGEFNDEYDENYKLITTGPFSISRHPIYMFSILFIVLRPYMTIFYLTLTILFIIYFYIGSYFEEKKLESIFDDTYRNYKQKVSRIFPFKWFVERIVMISKIKILALILIFSSTNAFSQNEDSVLVDLGSKKITVEEFVNRFEFTPWPRRNIRHIDEELKLEFLKTLIAEKLLSIHGDLNRIDTTYDLSMAFRNLEKMIVRDALYHKEIKNKVTVTPEELNNAFAKSQIQLYVRYIFEVDSASIHEIFDRLLSGESFDSLLNERLITDDQKYPMKVTYGTLVEEAENEVYRTEVENFTRPLRSDHGYYIFRVDSASMAVHFGPKELSDSYRKAEKILRQRNEDKLYREYFRKFFSKKKGEADGTAFWILADEVVKRFKYKFETQEPVRGNQYIIDPADVKEIEKNLGKDKDLTLIKMESRNAPISEFLRALLFKGFYVTDSTTRHIAIRLNNYIKSFLEDEYLAEEGYKQGMHHSPEVKKDLEMWRDFYLSTWYSNELKNNTEVKDEEIDNYISERGIKSEEVILVNVQEILLDSLEHIEFILNRLQEGDDFGELAKKYSKRKWAAEKNGEFGFFPSTMYGEIGKVAERLSPGEIYAPIETKDGFSVIKLLDKKVERPDTTSFVNYDDLKENIKKELRQKKFDNHRDKLVAELAQKYVRNINLDLLRNVKVTQLNMVVFRYMGFGGRMTAVPLISPYVSWYEEWKKIKKDLP